eukprot:scaffold263232_cov32-Tisochrysis_lutea.AAC.2
MVKRARKNSQMGRGFKGTWLCAQREKCGAMRRYIFSLRETGIEGRARTCFLIVGRAGYGKTRLAAVS